MSSPTDALLPPDAGAARAAREYAALTRLAERHAHGDATRHRHLHPDAVAPHEAVRVVAALVAGGVPLGPGEDPVDESDLTAALTLLPRVRAELDALELALLAAARGRGLTWQTIAFGLGLGTAQAAKQRYERLEGRAHREPPV